MRLKIIRIIVAGLFLIITFELFYLQVIQGQYYYRLSTNNRIRVVPLEGLRGRITDRNGEVLVDNRAAYNVMILPQDIANKDALFSFLAGIFHEDQETVMNRYYAKKFAPFAPVVVAEDVPREQAMVIEENKFRFPSLFVQEGFARIYPMGEQGAHVLGYIGKVNRVQKEKFKEYGYSPQNVVGTGGVEEYYDGYLKGGDGGLQIEVDSRGRQVRLLSLRESTQGQEIGLTVDRRLQEISAELLDGKVGAVVVMDIDNGEILGLTSSPSFNPNAFVDRERGNLISGYMTSSGAPLFNRAIQGVFPPGSTFKIPEAIGALHSGEMTADQRFFCDGAYHLGRSRFQCSHVHGSQNLIEAITHSCNVYFYNVGLILGPEAIYHYAKLFGLGSHTYIDLPYESKGLIPNPHLKALSGEGRWQKGDTLNLSIGQGDTLVTPIQLARMMGIIARDGIVVQPHIIKTIGGAPVDKYEYAHQIKIDADIFKAVKRGLRAVVADYSGTANIVNVKGLLVSGKTGTAQSSGNKPHHAWFTGFVLGAKKNISFCVFLEHGGSSYNAALLTRELLTRMKDKEIL